MDITTLTQKLKQDPLVKAVYHISQQVETPIYMVGGAIRDLLMGILSEKDFDFVMKNNLETVAHLFAKMASGHLIRWSANPVNYRVVFYRNNNLTKVDFSGFRGNDIYQDLANRDFTVNAIALMVNELFQEKELNLYDPMGGSEDLRGRSLRVVSPHAFDHDPLRMLRAVRIAKARSFTIEANTKEKIRHQKKHLFSVSAERIRSELFKIISLPDAQDSLKLLDDLGLLALLLPETEILKMQKEGAPLNVPLWDHSLETVKWCEWALDYLEELFPNLQGSLKAHFLEEIEAEVHRGGLLKLAGLLHHCEKLGEKMEIHPKLDVHVLKAKNGNIVAKVAKRFKLGRKATTILSTVIENYPRIAHLSQIKSAADRVYFRYFRDLGSEGLEVLILSWADVVSRGPGIFCSPLEINLRTLINSVAHYYFETFTVTSPQPLISGRDIIEQFGLKEGKVIGGLLNQVARAESEGLLSSSREALTYIEKLIKTNREGDGQ